MSWSPSSTSARTASARISSSRREACDELSRLTRSEQVQVIGTKFVLYRETHAKPKEKRIALVKDKKKKTV